MKVISFSVWGNSPSFLEGAIENAHLARTVYPGWTPRIYCRDDVPQHYRDNLEALGAQVVIKHETRGSWEGLFWRFHPVFDPKVTHTIVRDCDSRLTVREAVAVNEWLLSEKTFHTMRDHIEHTTVPIMGGMWGSVYWPVLGKLLEDWPDCGAKGDDQNFLAQRIWMRVRADALVHDRWPEGTDYDISEKDPLYKVFKYRPKEFHGEHDIRPFPEHEPVDAKFGAHVGDRVPAL